MLYPVVDNFLNSRDLSAWLCIKIARRIYLLITRGLFRVATHQLQQVLHAVRVTNSTAVQMTCASMATGSVMERKTAQMALMSRSVRPPRHSPRLPPDHLILGTVTSRKTCACGSLQGLQIWNGHGTVARHPAIKLALMAIIRLVQVCERRHCKLRKLRRHKTALYDILSHYFVKHEITFNFKKISKE